MREIISPSGAVSNIIPFPVVSKCRVSNTALPDIDMNRFMTMCEKNRITSSLTISMVLEYIMNERRKHPEATVMALG